MVAALKPSNGYHNPARIARTNLEETVMEVQSIASDLVKADRGEQAGYFEMARLLGEMHETTRQLIEHDEQENRLHAKMARLSRQLNELMARAGVVP